MTALSAIAPAIGVEQKGNGEYEMPTRRHADQPDEAAPDINLAGFAELMLRMQERSDERFARLIEAMSPSRRGWVAPVAAIVASVVALMMMLITLTGTRYQSATEGQLSEKVAVLTEKLESSERRQVDAQKSVERSLALLDERNRQLSIALEARGLMMPKQ